MTQTTNLTVFLTHAPLVPELRAARPEVNIVLARSSVPDIAYGASVVCFVDWLLPEMSGLELCRRLRDVPATRESRVTMVLEEADPDAMRRALRAGADDYVVGPLDIERLLARIDACAAPGAPRPAGELRRGDLVIDRAAHQVRWRGAAVPLRPNQFRLLAHFLAYPDQLFSRAALIDRIGKDGEIIDERTVDVWVGRLRRALAAHGVPDPLRTVRAMGYVLDSLPG